MASVASVVATKPGGKQVVIALEAVRERAYLSGQAVGVHPVCWQCPHAQSFTFVPPDAYEPAQADPILPMKEILLGGKRQLACVLPPPPWGGSPRILRVGRPAAVEVVMCCEAECPVYQAQVERYKLPQERTGMEQQLDLIQNPCRFCSFYDHCARQLERGFVD